MKKTILRFVSFVTPLAVASTAFAQDGASESAKMAAYLGAGIVLGLAALGGGIGQGRAAAAALEGIARNPNAANKIQTPMLLGLAFVESLVLFSFVMAYLLQSK